jgi:single-strand DNA-binding protein
MENVRNSVRLTGFAGQDPEFKHFSNEKRMAKVSLGVSEYGKGKVEDSKILTQWVNLVFWNKKVQLIDGIITKGMRFSIEGRLNIRTYEKDGEKRYSTEVVVNTLELAD